MKTFQINKILIPTDFSKTSLLAIEHAAFMARLCKADIYLLHAIEISESTYSIYNQAVVFIDNKAIKKIALKQLEDLAKKLRKEYAITVKTLCCTGKIHTEVSEEVKKNAIDLVVMGTHGVDGFNEFFIGSNAHKIVTKCPCPVITVQAHTKRLGFTKIILPVDDSLNSRQKVDYTIALAEKYAAKIYVLGLVNKNGDTDPKKFKIKMDSIEKAIKKAGLPYEFKIVKENNLAVAAMKYSKKVKADLITVLNDYESDLTGMFLGAFAKQIVNHSRIPVMSIRPLEGIYKSVSLAAANPF
ncbi:MAG: universal stress protein [Bacteroidetes bacterium]|nr:universal stress protein [Bacteroidota bacterium]